MKIIKASLRNALRRKWKFALVVFLFAVGLVVLTNVYDVVGAVERRVEFVEAVRNGDAVTREQVEATERDTGLMLFFAMLTYAFTLGTTVFAFVMPTGGHGRQRAQEHRDHAVGAAPDAADLLLSGGPQEGLCA